MVLKDVCIVISPEGAQRASAPASFLPTASAKGVDFTGSADALSGVFEKLASPAIGKPETRPSYRL
jgi:hypothetical protein